MLYLLEVENQGIEIFQEASSEEEVIKNFDQGWKDEKTREKFMSNLKIIPITTLEQLLKYAPKENEKIGFTFNPDTSF